MVSISYDSSNIKFVQRNKKHTISHLCRLNVEINKILSTLHTRIKTNVINTVILQPQSIDEMRKYTFIQRKINCFLPYFVYTANYHRSFFNIHSKKQNEFPWNTQILTMWYDTNFIFLEKKSANVLKKYYMNRFTTIKHPLEIMNWLGNH